MKLVLVKPGLSVSKEIHDIVNRDRIIKPKVEISLIKQIIEVSKPYDKMHWTKHKPRNQKILSPKIISSLAKIVNGKTKIDLITKEEFETMKSRLNEILKSWLLT